MIRDSGQTGVLAPTVPSAVGLANRERRDCGGITERNAGTSGAMGGGLSLLAASGGAIVYLLVSAFNFCVAAASNGSVDFAGLASYLPSD